MEVLNYGGGTQTAAICVLIARGTLPKPDRIVMADTSREVQSTWEFLNDHMRPLMAKHGLEIEVAPHALATVDLYSHKGLLEIPAFTESGKFHTYCSSEWKASVVERHLRASGVKSATQWIGYGFDERRRWNKEDPPGPWKRRFPLVDLLLTTDQCKQIIADAGYPLPSKSRCWMCPNQPDAEWIELRDKSPQEFAAAVALDERIREEDEQHAVFLHESRVPLKEVVFDASKQPRDKQCSLCFI